MITDIKFEDNNIICYNCGYKNPIDVLHCIFCGSNLLRNLMPAVLKEANEILKKKRNV